MDVDSPIVKSFIERINRDPTNESLRLQFADWLEENGDSDWGEHVRLEVETERLRKRRDQLWHSLTWEKRIALMHPSWHTVPPRPGQPSEEEIDKLSKSIEEYHSGLRREDG